MTPADGLGGGACKRQSYHGPGQYINGIGDDHAYLREFAAALVASLGYAANLEFCRSNLWDGVLEVLLSEGPGASIHRQRC